MSILEPAEISSIFEELLGRKPSPDGLAALSLPGLSRPELVAHIKASAEFRQKNGVSAPSLGTHMPQLQFEFVTHQIDGSPVTFALDQAATDSYSAALRKRPISNFCLTHLKSRAAHLCRPLKLVDVGANIGIVSLPAAASGAHVLAIEALPANFALLSAAVHANRFWGRVAPVLMAASDTAGIVLISGHSAWGVVDRTQTKGAPIPTDTIANILRIYGFTDADVLKVDIEGSEMAALTGIEEITDYAPGLDIVIESNSHTCSLFGYTVQDLWHRLHALGFTLFAATPKGLSPLGLNDPQFQTVVDILCTKQPGLVGPLAPLGEADFWASFEAIAKQGHPHHCAHVLWQEEYLSPAMRSDSRWQSIKSRAQAAVPPRAAAAAKAM